MKFLRAIWGTARSDALRWWRSPAWIAATLIPAIGMTFVVFGLTFAVGKQPVALVQEDQGPQANRMVEIISHSDGFFLKKTDPDTAKRDLDQQRVAAVIHIPADFEARVAASTAAVDVLINNVDIDFSDDIRKSVTEAVVAFNVGGELTGDQEGVEGIPPAIDPRTGAVHQPESGESADEESAEELTAGTNREANPYYMTVADTQVHARDVDFLVYSMVPVFILVALTAGTLVTVLAIAGDRQNGMLRLSLVSPSSRYALVGGRLLGGTLAAVGVTGLLFGASIVLDWVSVPSGRWPAVVALLVATCAAATGLGVLVGLLTRRLTSTMLLGVNVVAAAFLLGGGFTTISFLPAWIQRLAELTPTFYSVDGIREALFYDPAHHLATDIAIMFGVAMVSVVAGAVVLGRQRA